MSKKKIELTPTLDVDGILKSIAERYSNEDVNTIDGVKIDFENHWVHLRKSNTEPIIRIYTEASSQVEANKIADDMISEIKEIAKKNLYHSIKGIFLLHYLACLKRLCVQR